MRENNSPKTLQEAIALGIPLRVEEVARLLNISESSVYMLMKTGKLKSVEWSISSRRILPSELEKFIKGGTS